MAIQVGTHRLGPANATLTVLTEREGMAREAGHNLTLEVTSWEATLELGDSSSVALTADPGSIEVRAGENGRGPLTDADRIEIKGNILGKVLGTSQIAFRSSDVQVEDGELSISGDLTIGTRTNFIFAPISVGDDGTVSATIRITQSNYGIRPFTALLGQLRVSNNVHVVIEGTLTPAAPAPVDEPPADDVLAGERA